LIRLLTLQQLVTELVVVEALEALEQIHQGTAQIKAETVVQD
jgi:hypothetical protein